MLSLLSIRRKVPDTPSQKCNSLWFSGYSCNPFEFKCLSRKLRSGQISVRSSLSLVWNLAALDYSTPGPSFQTFPYSWSLPVVAESNLSNWEATNVTNEAHSRWCFWNTPLFSISEIGWWTHLYPLFRKLRAKSYTLATNHVIMANKVINSQFGCITFRKVRIITLSIITTHAHLFLHLWDEIQ